jgi:hypothetical protein
MQKLIVILMLAAWCGFSAEENPRADMPEIYTFAELLAKAERIVAADVGATKDGVASLVVRETIKAPENAPKYVSPERLKRAADMLADENLKLPALPADDKPPLMLRVHFQSVTAPREGTQAVFFLWERENAQGAGQTVYRIGHPQNVYDLEVLPVVKAGYGRPRSIADGRYLREWDRQAAERRRLSATGGQLLKAKGGETVMGLRLVARRPILSLRGNNSFGVTAVLENTRSRAQAVYDGPGGGYGVLLRPKDGSETEPVVLKQSTKALGADTAVLNIADLTDFATISAEGSVAKELFFDAQENPVLTTLSGDYKLAIFYCSSQDGKGLDVGSPVWTGTIISEEVPVHFENPAAIKRP